MNGNSIATHKCYCCDEIIAPAKISDEHIIPNALGGKLKSKTLLCSDCNSTLGSEVDAPFCQQMGFVTNRLGIKRERGEPPAIKARRADSGDPIFIESDRTTFAPRTIIQKTENGYSMECDKKNIYKAMETLKRKMPNALLSQVEPFESDLQFQYESDFGGMACYRAVTKIALNFFLHRGGSAALVSKAISFVKGGGNNFFVILYYPSRDVMPRRLAKQITHVVTIRGDPVQKFLYAYVELFTAFRFLVSLSETYDGNILNESYCFDLQQRQEIKTETQFYESRTTIADIAASPTHIEAFKKNTQDLFTGDLKINFA